MTGPAADGAELVTLASEVGPALNRLVFFGIEWCRPHFSAPGRVRATPNNWTALHALSTSSLERLAPDLTSAGWSKFGRDRKGEIWTRGARRLTIEAVPPNTDGDLDAIALEYACLLTRTISVGEAVTLRASALPAQLLLFWRMHAQSGADFTASAWVEDAIELVARRPAAEDDIASLPEEMRHLVAGAVAAFCAREAALWTIDRALPDARLAPGLSMKVLQRFGRIAAMRSAA